MQQANAISQQITALQQQFTDYVRKAEERFDILVKQSELQEKIVQGALISFTTALSLQQLTATQPVAKATKPTGTMSTNPIYAVYLGEAYIAKQQPDAVLSKQQQADAAIFEGVFPDEDWRREFVSTEDPKVRKTILGKAITTTVKGKLDTYRKTHNGSVALQAIAHDAPQDAAAASKAAAEDTDDEEPPVVVAVAKKPVARKKPAAAKSPAVKAVVAKKGGGKAAPPPPVIETDEDSYSSDIDENSGDDTDSAADEDED
jgi:hypothetical protein